MVKAISPSQVPAEKLASVFPDLVIQTWNRIIAKKFTAGRAHIGQDEIADAIAEATGVTRREVFDNHWLDVEEIYRAQGWEVEYDKPAYNESYEANFTFRQKRSGA